MDNIQDNKPVQGNTPSEQPKNEHKIRHNRKNPNNDIWIHLDTNSTDSNKFLPFITGISTLGALALVAVSLVQYSQTSALIKQNETLIQKYEQAMTQMNNANAKAIEQLDEGLSDLENGMSAIADSIGKLNIATNDANSQQITITPENPAPVVPEDDRAFLGILVMNDGSAITPLGLRITGLYEHSPAALAGLQAGDIIMALDDTPIDTFETLSAIIDEKEPGDIIKIRYARTQDNTVYFNEASVVLDSMSNYDTSSTQENP